MAVIQTNPNEYTFIFDTNIFNTTGNPYYTLFQSATSIEIITQETTYTFNDLIENLYEIESITFGTFQTYDTYYQFTIVYELSNTNKANSNIKFSNDDTYGYSAIVGDTTIYNILGLKITSNTANYSIQELNNILNPHIGTLTSLPITQLKPFLTSIANAIRTKKGTTDPINAQNFATEIESIESGGGDLTVQELIDARQGKASYLFGYATVNLWSNLDFSSVTTATYMWEHATVVEPLDVFLPNAANLSGCCQGSDFTKIKITTNTNETSYGSGFRDCYNAKVIDLSSIKGGYADYGLCNSCYSLEKLIIRTMDPIPPWPYDLVTNCYHFTGQYSSTYNPDSLQDGRIYVPDDKIEEVKAATGWSDKADIILPLSSLVEE